MRASTIRDDDQDAAWRVLIDDVAHAGPLAALANGCIGVVGDVGDVGARSTGTRATFVAGAYGAGGDALVRPLPGPTTTDIGGDPPGSTWWLDLLHGTLRRTDRAGNTTAERIVSIVRPGICVVRAEGRGPWPDPLAPPRVRAALSAHHTCEIGRGEGGRHEAVIRGGRDVIVAASVQDGGHGGRPLERITSVAHGDDAAATAHRELDAAVAVGARALRDEHVAAWEERWRTADIEIDGDPVAQEAIRFALFHLLSCARSGGESPVGARGLTGLAYAGHVFWDTDVYVLPALAATSPDAARSILEYRIRRLPAARARAGASGRAGARFPWESADTGEDVTPRTGRDLHGALVPISTGDLAEHITADVAWAASHHLDWTGDRSFLDAGGRALIVEAADYWMDRSQVDQRGAAHIYDVTGPDEYHECVDDEAYTNLLARWNLRRAAEILEEEGAAARASLLRDRADALVVGRRPGGRHEQFAGFDALEPVDLVALGPGPIAADLVLGRDRTARSKVLKQPAVLMAHHLLGPALAPEDLAADLRAELPLICHGSSLSPAICSALLARAGRTDEALDLFHLAGRMDLLDLTRSTAAGLHLATMGGLWQAVVHGFAGVRPCGDTLTVDPHLPSSWAALRIRLRFRTVPLLLEIDHRGVSARAAQPLRLQVRGEPMAAVVDEALASGASRHPEVAR